MVSETKKLFDPSQKPIVQFVQLHAIIEQNTIAKEMIQFFIFYSSFFGGKCPISDKFTWVHSHSIGSQIVLSKLQFCIS